MKVLLVEDNKNISKALTYSLEKNKYEVLNAETITKAQDLLNQDKIDLIILDITLPDGNGFDLYKCIKEKYDISTIFLTAKDDEDNIVKGLELGAEDYITKPFSTRELLARINRIVLRNKKKNIIKI